MTGPVSRAWQWFADRTGLPGAIAPIMRHTVPRNATWWYVLGSAALSCFLLQILTGTALALSYIPGANDAYESIRYITEDAPFGAFLRAMHFFGASAMIGLVILHMSQVYLHATYKFPREVNWMSGVLLFLFTIVMGFTGQVMRWDANAVWSIVVGVEQVSRVPYLGEPLARLVLGGNSPGGATLSRFFVLHVFILPASVMLLLGAHLALVLRNGISEMPDRDQPVDPATYRAEYEARLKKTGVPFFPDAIWRDAVFSMLVIGGILVASLVFGPPALDGPPDPSRVDVNPGPDWYLRWYFALLALSPHSVETYLILLVPTVAIGLLLCLPLISNRGDRAPSRRPWSIILIGVAALLLGILTVMGYTEPWSPRFDAKPLSPAIIASDDPTVVRGGELFSARGCLYCHTIQGHGGRRGPNLTEVGVRLTREQMIIRVNHGGYNMPSFASTLTAEELEALIAFLETRKGPARPGGG